MSPAHPRTEGRRGGTDAAWLCRTLADFHRFPKALTANGQLKGGRGRHEKDDRKDLADRRNFVLGWDNQDKINRFLVELEEAKGQLQVAANADLQRVEERANKLQQRLAASEKDAENLAEAIAECGTLLQEQPLTGDAGVLASVAGLAAAALAEKVLTYKNTVLVIAG